MPKLPWLTELGLMIQVARPLHEGTFATLEVYPGSGNEETGKQIENFWRAHGLDPYAEGKGCAKKVEKIAREIVTQWKEETKGVDDH